MSISVSFPSGKIFAKQNNAVTVTRTAAEDALKFTLHWCDISITRTFNASASLPATLIFPVDSLFEMIVGDSPTKTIQEGELSISFEADTEYSPNEIILINGASFYPFSEIPTNGQLGFPQPKSIIVYTNLYGGLDYVYPIPVCINLNTSYLCLNTSYNKFDTYSDMENSQTLIDGMYCYVIDEDNFYRVGIEIVGEEEVFTFTLTFNGEQYSNHLVDGNQAFLSSGDIALIEFFNGKRPLTLTVQENSGQSFGSLENNISIVCDSCTAKDDEVYLRWFDIYGYTLHYRFKRKELMNDFKITDTFKSFDASLIEYKKQKKTYDKVYTLSSNLVDADTFDWLKRIGIGRNVELFDGTTWVKALVGEVSISGQDEQNTVMFKVTTEELVPTL